MGVSFGYAFFTIKNGRLLNLVFGKIQPTLANFLCYQSNFYCGKCIIHNTFNSLSHLRHKETLNCPIRVPVVHLPEPASGHDERPLHVDEAELFRIVPDLLLDLPAEFLPARVDLDREFTVTGILVVKNVKYLTYAVKM